MRIVLDANVVVAAFAARGLCESLFELCLGSHEIVLSERLLPHSAYPEVVILHFSGPILKLGLATTTPANRSGRPLRPVGIRPAAIIEFPRPRDEVRRVDVWHGLLVGRADLSMAPEIWGIELRFLGRTPTSAANK